jgi:Mg-chelatase subunit ChlD
MATKIVFVLDRSGSMQGLETDVIGGFNAFLHEQQKVKGKATVTTILFDTNYEVLHDGINVKDVPDMDGKQYQTLGMTALLDAVGKAISTTAQHLKDKDNVIFIINTDGEENSSKEYNNEQIKKLIEEKQATKKWNFMFFGVNVDKFAISNKYGININFVTNYSPTRQGTQSLYSTTSTMTTQYRNSGGTVLDADALKDVK